MIKNNKNKAQEVLNSMLLPVKEVKENIIANKNLTELHKNNLLQMVCDFESYESKYDYKEALKIIAQIMQPYQNKTKSVVCQDGKQVEMPVGAKAMPYLIKQVLFYIVVMCKQYHNMNQKEILAILKENGIIVSHNFFSGNLPVTPIQYIQMMEHTQKESPIKYKGKKEGKLGIAIKHLAYQAGKYNNFVDIFGGSASATLAVSKRKGVTYVYNEKNKMMYHLIKIISDEKKYIRLIDALNSLKLDLEGKGEWLEDIDWDEEIELYYSSKRNNDKKEDIIIYDNVSNIDLEFSEVISYMKEIQQDLLQESEEYELFFEGNQYTKKQLLETIFMNFGVETWEDSNLFMSFLYHFPLIHYYSGKRMDSLVGTVYKGTKGTVETVTINHRLEQFMQYRFYKYYAYFSNLLKEENKEYTKEKEILYAVAQFYIQFFRCNGDVGVSSILRMLYVPEEKNTVSNDWKRFLSQDFSKMIKEVHHILNPVEIQNKEYYEIVSLFHNKKTLFYSDSPYIMTSDYIDEVNGVSEFTKLDTQRLIDGLFGNYFATKSEEYIGEKRKEVIEIKKLKVKSSDKFIFSCRAIKSFRNNSKNTKKLQKDNQIILKYVFGTFLDYVIQCNTSLYVLAIEAKKQSVVDLIKENKKVEIMITNFEIFPFEDKLAGKETKFVVYSFEQFFKILIENTNMKIEKEEIK